MTRISINIEEENYKLAKVVQKQAVEKQCWFSYAYSSAVAEQILDKWCSRAINITS